MPVVLFLATTTPLLGCALHPSANPPTEPATQASEEDDGRLPLPASRDVFVGETIRCTVADAYEPSDRARADSCNPLEIPATDCVDVGMKLARDVEALGYATAIEVEACIGNVVVIVPPDDVTFERVCGDLGDNRSGAQACSYPLGEGPYAREGATWETIMRWDMTLVSPSWARAVLRHEMIHRVIECVEGDGDAAHANAAWLALDTWEELDTDPDGDGEPGCQSSCDGCAGAM